MSKMRNEMSSPDQWLLLYGDTLYHYGYLRVRDPDIAEDLVQETLLAALKARHSYTGLASEKTWLIGILKHKISDFFRQQARDKTLEFNDYFTSDDKGDDYFNQQGGWQIDLSSWSKPETVIEQEQLMQILQECIDRLPSRMAQLFVLRELEGLKNKEICEMMSILSLNNLWVMLSRTRVQLRHCLDINWVKQ
jgi:RNA polymerase sigma-70 factor (ECF subfamily)